MLPCLIKKLLFRAATFFMCILQQDIPLGARICSVMENIGQVDVPIPIPFLAF